MARLKKVQAESGVDPIKLIQKRNETAQAHAEVAKSLKASGNIAAAKNRVALGNELIARNESDLARNDGYARKQNPRAARKAAAVEAFTKEFGRKPPGRMSAATLEQRVKSMEFTRAQIAKADATLKVPAPRPPTSSTMTMPSRMPAATLPPPPASRFPQWGGGNDLHEPHGLSSGGRGMITKGMLGIGVGAAAVQGYMQARDSGDSVGTAAAKGALSAVPQALVAGAPYVQKAGTFMKEAGFGVGKAVLDNYDFGTYAADRLIFDGAIAGTGVAGGIMGTAGKAIETFGKVAGKFAIPASLAMGAAVGALKDENRLRGAGRGMVSALDPTALFMKKGIAERLYDSAFGEGDRPIGQQPVMNRDNPHTDTHRGKGGINRFERVERHSSLPAPQHFAAANESFRANQKVAAAKAPDGNHLRGFQNPNNLIAAIKAKGGDASRIAPA